MSKPVLYFVAFVAFSMVLTSCANRVEKPANTGEAGLVKYPEKGEMRLLTDRPPQLETPLRIFKQDITPNEYFFVRWHLSQIPTSIDIDTFRLYVGGAVDSTIALSMNDLKTKFAPDSIVALTICSGNSRSTFEPRVPGSQWGNGAMGNAKWKGVRLKDILERAGMKPGAFEVSLQGLDRAPMPATPTFVRSLRVDHIMNGEMLVAYEMNGQPIPMLNGYPLKLVVPGWYASYWVSCLARVTVLTDTFHGFWVDQAYRITTDSLRNETPDNLSKTTVPLTRINLHSIFVTPGAEDRVTAGKSFPMEGLAFDDGTGIKKVEVSFDDGKTWVETRLNPVMGKYSWRRWKYDWLPATSGTYHLKVRATDINGHTEMDKQWNRSGYARGFIERLDVNVH